MVRIRTVGILYLGHIVIRLLAFLRFYFLSRIYGANAITDKYLLFLLAMETLASLLANNHVISLLMRYLGELKLPLEKAEVFSAIIFLIVLGGGLGALVVGVVMIALFGFSVFEGIFAGIIGYFFVVSVAIQSILNHLEQYELVVYQGIIGHLVLMIGVFLGSPSLLYASLALFGIVRVGFVLMFLLKKNWLSLRNFLSLSLHFLPENLLKELGWIVVSVGMGIAVGFFQNFIIQKHGVGYLSAYNYAFRLISAIAAFVLMPVGPVITNYFIKLNRVIKRRIIRVLWVRFMLFNLLLFVLAGSLWIFAPLLIKVIYFHGAFTYKNYELTLRFFRALVVVLWSFNLLSIVVKGLLVTHKVKMVFVGYLLGSALFLLFFMGCGNIFSGLFWGYFASGGVFLVLGFLLLRNLGSLASDRG